MSLKTDHLSKRFGHNIWALRDIDLDIEDGETFGILGESHSGKSTLLKLIAGTEKPTTGEIHPGAAANVRLVSGTSNARKGFFGRAAEAPSKTLVQDALADGRGAVAFDDCFQHLDSFEKRKAFAAVRNAADRTILIASRNFQDLAESCDRIAVLVGGYLAQVGTPQEIYQTPANSGAAFATGELNRFDARRLTSTDAGVPEFYTVVGGHRLFAQPTTKAALGPLNQTINLAIRPEHISITTGASFPEDNLLKAIVRDIRFLGASTRVLLDADGLELSASVPRVVGLSVGEECMIALPPPRVHVLQS
ncbi:MAG TPA: ATP-binding cassette domain-containing protein [Pyrinomonadaceae bacterium]|nr:ATP-binding cassette domain-containing protein [Pyrinomonadaceae bacterium]